MSDKKEYSAVEVARKVLERVQEQLKKNENLLAKAKNTAHEIEPGQEPSVDTAECPDYLASADFSSSGEGEQSQTQAPKKKKKPESEESESEEMEESESEESESEESESGEPEYDFKKSESGMYTVEYKVLKKARVDEGKSVSEKKEIREDRASTQTRGERNPYDRGLTGTNVHHDTEWNGSDKPGKNVGYTVGFGSAKSKKTAVKGIKADAKRHIEAHKKHRPNLPKSEESGMEKEESLKKLGGMTSSSGAGGTLPPTPAPGTSIASQIGFGKNEGKKKDKKSEDPKKEDQPLCGAPMDKADEPERPVFGIDHSEDKQKEQTVAQKKMTDWDRGGMPGAKRGSRDDQVKFDEEAKKRRQKYAEEGKIARSEPVMKSATETKGIDLDQPRKSDKEKEQRKRPMEKCGDIEVGAKKAEKSDTCGIMKREKGVEKLGKFLAKGENKIH